MRSHTGAERLDVLHELKEALRKPAANAARWATGFAQADALLAGGLPCGQVTELSGAPSSGKATLALGACLRVLAAQQTAAWITPEHVFFPLGALEAGFDLDRLLVLHVQQDDGLGALRGAQLVLGCPGAVSLLVVDLPGGFMPKAAQLAKLQRLAEHAACALVFLTERPATAPSLGTAVSLRLYVSRTRASRPDAGGLKIEILRWKSGPSAQSVQEAAHGPDRVRVRSTL